MVKNCSGKPKVGKEAQETETQMGIKVYSQDHFCPGLGDALSLVQRAASFSLPHNQIHPGLFYKVSLTHAQSQAEEVEQRELWIAK